MAWSNGTKCADEAGKLSSWASKTKERQLKLTGVRLFVLKDCCSCYLPALISLLLLNFAKMAKHYVKNFKIGKKTF